MTITFPDWLIHATCWAYVVTAFLLVIGLFFVLLARTIRHWLQARGLWWAFRFWLTAKKEGKLPVSVLQYCMENAVEQYVDGSASRWHDIFVCLKLRRHTVNENELKELMLWVDQQEFPGYAKPETVDEKITKSL